MYETPEELTELQELIDRSFAHAGSHLTSIAEPDRRLTAEEVVAYLVGVKHGPRPSSTEATTASPSRTTAAPEVAGAGTTSFIRFAVV